MNEIYRESKAPHGGAARRVMNPALPVQREAERMNKEVRKMDKILEKLKRTELQEFTNYLSSPWRILWANFLAGTARGLGFLLGVALVLTAVGFVLTQLLSQIPIVGEFFQAIYIWIQSVVNNTSNNQPPLL